MSRQLLYATTNPGKLMEIRKLLAAEGLAITGPDEIGLALDVAETGDTLEENAILKARAYRAQLGTEWVVLGDDTGVEIDALDGEPGIHVRRWTGGERMSDEEVLVYCLERLAGVPLAQRGAQFRTAFAIAPPDADAIAVFDGTLRGVILEEPDPLRIPGFPFESIFYVPEWGRLLGAIFDLPPEQKAPFVTHRERALRTALPYLRRVLGNG